MKRSFIVAALAAVAACAQAAPIAYTGLEGQTPGVLSNTITDGTGWLAWDPQNETAGHTIANTTPLTFGGLATSADGNYATGAGNWTSLGRRLVTSNAGPFQSAGLVSDPWTLGTVDTGTVWVSFLTRVNSTSTELFFHFHQNNIAWSDAGSNPGVMIGQSGGTWSAAPTNGAYAASATPVVANTTTLMVGRFNFNGADSSFHFWAFDDAADVTLGGADLTLASATSSITGVAATAIDFKSFKAYLNNGSANTAALDEIRFGTSFADVTPAVPEPGMIGLIAMGGLLLGRRRA